MKRVKLKMEPSVETIKAFWFILGILSGLLWQEFRILRIKRKLAFVFKHYKFYPTTANLKRDIKKDKKR